MADEIRVTASLSFAKSGSSDRFDVNSLPDMTGTQYVKKTQTIGITEEAIDKGDITNVGYFLIRNMDTVNYVQVGAVATQYCFRVMPGESAGPVRWDTVNILAKANVAQCVVEYLVIEA